jgi:hypothetical protein
MANGGVADRLDEAKAAFRGRGSSAMRVLESKRQ